MVLSSIPSITIDGPSASGKGTVAKLLAKHFGWHYLDSGGIYRCVGFLAHQNNITPNDVHKLLVLVKNMRCKFIDDHVFLNETDVTNEIRSEQIAQHASIYAANPDIRHVLLHIQRSHLMLPGLVADGRDMGNIVFPNSLLKIFLNADINVRARRRYEQLQQYSKSVKITEVLSDLTKRDQQDSQRSCSPLVYSDLLTMLDNSNLTILQTVEMIADMAKKRGVLPA